MNIREKPGIKKLSRRQRQAVRVRQDRLIREENLLSGGPLPLLVRPEVAGLALLGWARENRPFISEKLPQHGGILFRGFDAGGTESFAEFVRETAEGQDLLSYVYRSTPRTRVNGDVYTTTEYPAHQTIPQHNENSFARRWPMKIAFHCVRTAAEGGETPLADSRRVLAAVDAEVRERFTEKQVMYVRNYAEGLDLPWQEVFQTSERSRVEAYCREAGIEAEWKDGDRLRTRQVCQAVAEHPSTGELVWFNQAHLFHVSNLEESVREYLLSEVGEENLPRNAFYGDGSEIEPEALADIRRVYVEEQVSFPWLEGDVLLLDNMLTSHGRNPFSGPRKVEVAMAQGYGGVFRG